MKNRLLALYCGLLMSTMAHPAQPIREVSGQINLSVDVSRVSDCVAPCYVFFDAKDTTSTATSAPFHEIDFTWDFGDPAGGAGWTYGARTSRGGKNIAKGPVAAHVFENAGTYTVTLTAFDGTHTASTTRTVEVSDASSVFSGSKTACVAATSMPVAGSEGCPSGAETYEQSDWPTIVNRFADAGRRVLLKRGDIFTGPATARLNRSGPGIIGAYGSGANPVIRTTGTARYSNILSITGASDWRIMDLDFDGQAVSAGDSGTHRSFMSAFGSQKQLLFLRVTAHDLGGGMVFTLARSGAPHDQVAIADSKIERLWSNSTANGGGIFLSGTRLAIMGNLFNDSTLGTNEHMIRIQHMRRGVISGNTIQMVNPIKEMIAIRGICSGPCGGGPYSPGVYGSGEDAATRWVMISDNHIKTNSYVGIQIDTGGSSSNVPTIIRDVIVERNWHVAQGGSGNSGIRIRAQDVTVRNELIDLSLASAAQGVQIWGATAGDPVGSRNLRVFNAAGGALGPWVGDNGGFRIAEFFAATNVTNVWIQNNLAYAPSAGTGKVRNANNAGVTAYEGVSGAWVCTNNSTGMNSHASCGSNVNQIKLANPDFTNSPPKAPADWKPKVGSYAIGAGVRVPVWSDFFLAPQPARRDLGAIVH
jgi:hypothetical protein